MPQIRFRDASATLRTLARGRFRDAAGTLRTIQRVRVRDASNTLRTVYTYLTLVLNTDFLYEIGSGSAASGSVTTTTSAIGTVTGGTGPFTYAWQRISGSLGITINSPATATTAFSGSVSDGSPKAATFKLVVTDANGAVAESPILSVELVWFDTR